MFFTRVCDSVHKGGICPIACWNTHPPGPEAGTPQDQTAPSSPQDKRQAPPRTRSPIPIAVHAGIYGQAGGTHPTGMQSCLKKRWLILPSIKGVTVCEKLPGVGSHIDFQ